MSLASLIAGKISRSPDDCAEQWNITRIPLSDVVIHENLVVAVAWL